VSDNEALTPVEARQAETLKKAQDRFLEGLRGSKSVSGAAKYAGVSRATVYRWREDDPAFAQDWDDAYNTGTDVLEEEATRRATMGVPRMKFYKGQPIMVKGADGVERPYIENEMSDTLLMQQLNARRPEKYRTNHKVEHTGGVKVVIGPDDADL
jgi:hypothetical protein